LRFLPCMPALNCQGAIIGGIPAPLPCPTALGASLGARHCREGSLKRGAVATPPHVLPKGVQVPIPSVSLDDAEGRGIFAAGEETHAVTRPRFGPQQDGARSGQARPLPVRALWLTDEQRTRKPLFAPLRGRASGWSLAPHLPQTNRGGLERVRLVRHWSAWNCADLRGVALVGRERGSCSEARAATAKPLFAGSTPAAASTRCC